MGYRNSLKQGKNSPRPQHYRCFSRISLENSESKGSRKLVFEEVMLETLSARCEVLSPSSSLLQLSRRQGGDIRVSYREESEGETL